MSPRAPAPEIRVGLIGYGLAGAAFHAPLVAATPGLRLAAVVTRDPERRAAARRDHPGAELVEDADALWARADALDLAVVASPNRTHVPLAAAALAAGLHVVVDKPVAATADDARRLAADAHARGRLLVPYHNRRWDGDFLTLRRLLAEGALGDVLRFESRFERWRPTPKPGWRQSAAPEDAGGLLYDIGPHLIDQALALFGPATHVYAELDRRLPGVVVDDDAFVALTHATGVRSHLAASTVAARPGARFRILGTRAAYVKEGPDVQEGALRAGARPDRAPWSDTWGEEPEAAWGRLGAGDETRPVRTERGDYRRFYAGMVAAIRGEASPPVDVADAVAGLEVIEAARRSAAEGAVVGLRVAGGTTRAAAPPGPSS